MSEERSNSGSGAVVAIVVVVMLLGLFVVVAGGLGALFFVRSSQMSQLELRAMLEAERAQVEAQLATAQAREAAVISERAQAELEAAKLNLPPANALESASPQLLLEIDLAGQFTLDGKSLSLPELQATLIAKQLEQGSALQLSITAQPETPFKQVIQAMDAAKNAKITKVHLVNGPPAVEATPGLSP